MALCGIGRVDSTKLFITKSDAVVMIAEVTSAATSSKLP